MSKVVTGNADRARAEETLSKAYALQTLSFMGAPQSFHPSMASFNDVNGLCLKFEGDSRTGNRIVANTYYFSDHVVVQMPYNGGEDRSKWRYAAASYGGEMLEVAGYEKITRAGGPETVLIHVAFKEGRPSGYEFRGVFANGNLSADRLEDVDNPLKAALDFASREGDYWRAAMCDALEIGRRGDVRAIASHYPREIPQPPELAKIPHPFGAAKAQG